LRFLAGGGGSASGERSGSRGLRGESGGFVEVGGFFRGGLGRRERVEREGKSFFFEVIESSSSLSSFRRRLSLSLSFPLTFKPIFSTRPVSACLNPDAPCPAPPPAPPSAEGEASTEEEEAVAPVVAAPGVVGDDAEAKAGTRTAVGVAAASAAVTGFPAAVAWTTGTGTPGTSGSRFWGRCIACFCFERGRERERKKEREREKESFFFEDEGEEKQCDKRSKDVD